MNTEHAKMINDDLGGEQTFNGMVLPTFMKPIGNRVDGWVPSPSGGDDGTDFVLGEIYADMAVVHAREVKNPTAISFILACIASKVARGEINYGPTEEGFTDRIARLACAGSLN